MLSDQGKIEEVVETGTGVAVVEIQTYMLGLSPVVICPVAFRPPAVAQVTLALGATPLAAVFALASFL
jgi:hypothetical protein